MLITLAAVLEEVKCFLQHRHKKSLDKDLLPLISALVDAIHALKLYNTRAYLRERQ